MLGKAMYFSLNNNIANNYMPIKKWLIQYLLALPLVFLLLAGIQYLKNRGLEYSIQFGLLWAFISVSIFFAARGYYFRKGMHCKISNEELPK